MNENLTPQIVAALLQDGTCKLTKAQMEAVVAPAVAALGKKYRFLGVAQPNTAPGSIPVPTLFVAVADGTYPSFSNQSVDGGDIAFFTSDDGGAWALTLIVPTPTDVPKPIVLSGFPNSGPTTQEALDAIGLTESELEAARKGLRTGVVVGTDFYFISCAYLQLFSFAQYAGASGAHSLVDAYSIQWNGADIEVFHNEG